MRDIRFRAWDDVTLAMYEVSILINNGRVGVVIEGCAPFYKDNCIIMQYTGLKDKNGKEIYEGDIISFNRVEGFANDKFIWVGDVIFKNGNYIINFLSIETDDMKIDLEWHIYPYTDNYTVIGNVYENPELLKE